MKLSELKTGEHGIIVKVLGHGGFRKRIVEMGFIKGQEVEVLLNAPLHDPVKYRLMGYEVSLRHQEADMIEVYVPQDADATGTEHDAQADGRQNGATAQQKATINVALVGNPTAERPRSSISPRGCMSAWATTRA